MMSSSFSLFSIDIFTMSSCILLYDQSEKQLRPICQKHVAPLFGRQLSINLAPSSILIRRKLSFDVNKKKHELMLLQSGRLPNEGQSFIRTRVH